MTWKGWRLLSVGMVSSERALRTCEAKLLLCPLLSGACRFFLQKRKSCSQASLLFEDTVWSRISASFLATWSLTAQGILGITLKFTRPGLRTSENGDRPFPILDVGGGRGGDGGEVTDVTAGIKPEPGHLEATGPCTLTLPFLLMGISLAHEEQVPLLE